jgi:hypothetical protein
MDNYSYSIINYKKIPKDFCIWSNSERRIIELESCPFCGGRAFLNCAPHSVYGQCSKCSAKGGAHTWNEKAAIENWNKRVN